MKLFKPMKGVELPNTELLKYPCMQSPKIDGIRATKQYRNLHAASLKLIPNKFLQNEFKHLPHGLDGELKVGAPYLDNFKTDTVPAVMTINRESDDVFYYVFDLFMPGVGFLDRYVELSALVKELNHPKVILVDHQVILHASHLEDQYQEYIRQGYEGSMIRSLNGPYKQGKSTVNEGYLYKRKDFADSEAIIIECLPLLVNHNETIINEKGYKTRSTAMANREAIEELGAFVVQDITSGKTFSVGTGFSHDERVKFWINRKDLLGKMITYRYLKTGGYDKPRNLSFKGFRNPIDMTTY
jgi:DNA ligase-1